MQTAQEFLNDKQKSSFLIAGDFGEGKTTVGLSFPKFFYIGFRQGGLEVIRKPENVKYQKNLIAYEELCPKNDQELKECFDPAGRKGRIYKAIDRAKEMAQKGEVETLFVDDVSDWSTTNWQYICQFERIITASGADDIQRMYGKLYDMQWRVLTQDLMTFRRFGNVVLTTHLMRETAAVLEGTQKVRASAVDRNSDLFPDILGSLRREIQRKFENVIYMEAKLQGDGKSKKYIGYTEKQVAMGTVVKAKNVLGLSPIIENISYETLFTNKPTAPKAV